MTWFDKLLEPTDTVLGAIRALRTELEIDHEVNLQMISKAIGLPEGADPGHTYVMRSGDFGIYQYWWMDPAGNYWRYSNASADSPDYDPLAGEPLLEPEQPMPHTAPQFYSPEGRKRHMAPPPEAELEANPHYSTLDKKNVWYEMYQGVDGQPRYIYLDSDIKENPELHVAHQLRLVDVGITRFRQFANTLFNGSHPKDRVVGCLLVLMDQGYYDIEDLINATVGDLEFIDTTVRLLGRKFTCDIALYDFLVSLIAERDLEAPLFKIDSVYGSGPVGPIYMGTLLSYLHVSPKYLQYWHINEKFSKIVHRLVLVGTKDNVIETALDELQRYMCTDEDLKPYIHPILISTLVTNAALKGLSTFEGDNLGVPHIESNLTQRTPDEMDFSLWLHTHPLHEVEEEGEDVE